MEQTVLTYLIHYLLCIPKTGTNAFCPLSAMHKSTVVNPRCAFSADDKGIPGKVEPLAAPRGNPKHEFTGNIHYPFMFDMQVSKGIVD